MWTNILIPTIYTLVALPAVVLNTIVMYVLLTGQFIQRKKFQGVFVISISELLADTVFLLTFLIGGVPLFYAQAMVISTSLDRILAYIAGIAWLVSCLTKASMALNRFSSYHSRFIFLMKQ
ncbi:unnamed protein product [Anisakis simplex]|uniref:7TM_GPCR_Srx domain-containing protein n=1 Tax=Anisakis simplex TaxID=6269 RepID=A0A0M3J1Z6_ANISI|nr:unnamed protein product [Anisakis simplex]